MGTFKAEWERRLDGARRLLAAAELEGGQREWGQARGEYDGAEGEEDRADAVTKRDNTERVERRVGKARQRTQELDEEYQRLKWKADRGFPWEKSILNTKPPVVRSRKCNGGSPLRRKIDVIAMEGDALAETDEAKESAANTAFDPSVVTEEDVQQLAAVRGSCWRTASAVDTIYLLYENSEDYASSWDAGSCESQEVPTQQPGSSSGYWDPAIDAEDSSSRVSAWYSSTSARIEADATPNVAYFGALALSESSAKTAAETEVETAAPDLEDSESEIDLRETQTAQAGVNRTPLRPRCAENTTVPEVELRVFGSRAGDVMGRGEEGRDVSCENPAHVGHLKRRTEIAKQECLLGELNGSFIFSEDGGGRSSLRHCSCSVKAREVAQ
ncbi:hypothetical protein H2203_006453 [Taxawa tesnikishii (nom. ined.)]|nr:hypothetical protein H2203_006453 [Dothideales sp. JES 119]